MIFVWYRHMKDVVHTPVGVLFRQVCSYLEYNKFTPAQDGCLSLGIHILGEIRTILYGVERVE